MKISFSLLRHAQPHCCPPLYILAPTRCACPRTFFYAKPLLVAALPSLLSLTAGCLSGLRYLKQLIANLITRRKNSFVPLSCYIHTIVNLFIYSMYRVHCYISGNKILLLIITYYYECTYIIRIIMLQL